MREKYAFSLPENVEFIIEKFNKNRYRADIVGGCVRDFLLGTVPHDYDLTTDATPAEMIDVFEGHRLIETGIKHGTLTLMLDGTPYEITTYRIDGDYADNRHPDSVTFSKRIEDDLSRRDFTMNAIAYNPNDGLTDPFAGISDIENRVIRAVGDPYIRFSEDALRILRGIRFSSVLGFNIEDETSKAIKEKRALLSNVSAERIYVEWKKLLSGANALSVIKEHLGVISVFLPEISSVTQIPEHLFSQMTPEERNIILFYYNAPDKFSSAMKRLKTDNQTAAFGQNVIDCLASISKDTPISDRVYIARLLNKFGEATALTSLHIASLIGLCNEAVLDSLKQFLADGAPYRISDLAVNGNDLISVGINGKSVGEALAYLLDAVISGETENVKSSLLELIKKRK